MATKNKKGRFVKQGHSKQVTALSKGRNTRWNSECHSVSNAEAILSNELDHSYNLSSENQDPVYNVSRQEDIVSDCTSDVELEWRTGRRVVELGTLANGLKACQLCSQPLHLINTVGERRFGLAQILEVKCMYSECGLVNDVPTGSKHTSQNGGQAWDVNTKLAAGMITMQYCMYIFKISTITCIQCLSGISIIQYVLTENNGGKNHHIFCTHV